TPRRVEAGGGAGNEAGARGSGAGPARVCGADSIDGEVAVRGERDRFFDVRSDRGLADHRRIAGLLDSGAAGDKGGSDGRAQNRIDVGCQMSDASEEVSRVTQLSSDI